MDGCDVVIRIGDAASATSALRAFHATSAAIVTAFNPRSRLLEPSVNAERNAHLESNLAALGFRYVHCAGVGDHWREESVVVFDAELDDAIDLGRSWDQNTIVWLNHQVGPVLVVTTDGFAGAAFGSILATSLLKSHGFGDRSLH